MQNKFDRFEEAERAMLTAIDQAIDRAAEAAGNDVPLLASRKSPRDYFADGALRHLFLRLCGADPKTNTGGDPDMAWTLLYMGRSVARHWERERGDPSTIRMKKERREDLERDERERQERALAAQSFALKTVVRVLVDHARASDPEMDQRLQAAVEAYIAKLEPGSDTEREFAERLRSHVSFLASLPEA